MDRNLKKCFGSRGCSFLNDSISRWTGSVGTLLLLATCSCSPDKTPDTGLPDKEPVYAGLPLSEWAQWTQDQSMSGPSAMALEAGEAVRAIGPDKAIPFLVHWIARPRRNSTFLDSVPFLKSGTQPPRISSTLPSAAVECFRILGPEAKAAIPELAKILEPTSKNVDDSARMRAAEALSYLGPDAVPVLLPAARRFHGQHLQWVLIEHMTNFGTNGAAAKPAILEWSRDPNAWVRLGSLHAYAAIEDDKQAAVEFLLSALNDPDELVRRDAAEYLGYVAQGQRNVLSALLKALDDPDWNVRSGAIGGLGRLGVERSVVLPLLQEALQDENRIIRRCAAFALGDMGGEEAFQALLDAADDPDGFVREAVFQSLKRIDADALEKSGKRFY